MLFTQNILFDTLQDSGNYVNHLFQRPVESYLHI
jgi:hypothetical protein